MGKGRLGPPTDITHSMLPEGPAARELAAVPKSLETGHEEICVKRATLYSDK